MSEVKAFVNDYLEETARTLQATGDLTDLIVVAAEVCKHSLVNGRKIIFCGNGGSAADAQHLAAELMGRFMIDRDPLPALSLTVDTSALTAIANDYGYDNVFSRQLRGIGVAGDVLVGMSTSGNSRSIISAFEVARELGIKTIGLTGSAGRGMASVSDILLEIPSSKTSHIQEAHITVGHLICAIVERDLCSNKR